jgi:hypothetical protein
MASVSKGMSKGIVLMVVLTWISGAARPVMALLVLV